MLTILKPIYNINKGYLKARKFSTNCPLLSDNPGNNPSQPEEVPALVHSRAVADFDSSTIPDTDSNISRQARNLASSTVNKIIHDSQTDYVKSPSGKNLRDWDYKDIEKLEKKFDNAESKQDAQALFDEVYNDITSAYNSVKETAKQDKIFKLGQIRINPYLSEQEKAHNIRQVDQHYADMERENTQYYEVNKGALIDVSDGWGSVIERKGFDYTFKKKEGLLSDSDSDSDPTSFEQGKAVKRKLSDTGQDNPEQPSSSRVKQDSSEVVQTDFLPFDPFGEE
jgi:hypothetical protein